MLKAAAVVHVLALALMAGGIAGIGLAAGVIFGRAPTREVAGQIGNTLFARLGPAVLVLSLVAMAARILLHRGEPPSWWRAASTILAVLTAVLAAAVALWLTPRMNAIWSTAPHAEDGSGLLGDARSRFLMLHGISNLLYMSIMILGAVQLALSGLRRL